MNKIGGNAQIREELTQALAEGREVTAKVRWLAGNNEEGQNRWIYFTPLIGSKGQIGAWVAILEDDDKTDKPRAGTGPVNALPQNGLVRVASTIEEESSDFEDNQERNTAADARKALSMQTSTKGSSSIHTPKISWSGSAITPEQRKPDLNWAQNWPESPLSKVNVDAFEIDEDYQPLEERLRKKRERDAAMMLDQSGLPTGRKTYKSLAPASFMSVE